MKKLSYKKLEKEYYNYLYFQDCYEDLINDLFLYFFVPFRNKEVKDRLFKLIACYYRGKYEERKK